MSLSSVVLDKQIALWKCIEQSPLDSLSEAVKNKFPKELGSLHSDEDIIGLDRVSSIEIADSNNASKLIRTPLDTESVKVWLASTEQRLKAGATSVFTAIYGEQSHINDGLRCMVQPQGTFQCTVPSHDTTVSRKEVSRVLNLPASAIQSLGLETAQSLYYPPGPSSDSSIRCYSMIGSVCSLAWTYNCTTRSTCAMIIMRRKSFREQREGFIQALSKLKDFSHLPQFLPYVMLDTEVQLWSRLLFTHGSVLDRNTADLQRFLLNRQQLEIYGEATSRVHSLGSIQRYAPSLLQLVQPDVIPNLEKKPHITDDVWNILQPEQQTLQQAITFRKQELKQMLQLADEFRNQTTTQLSTIVGMMSFNQQEASQDIAKATKEDGTSMKTLAVIAAFYLPSTAVSAIMALPLFNWSAPEESTVVSPRIWVFFAVALPLTLLTMFVFWFWVQREHYTSIDVRSKVSPMVDKLGLKMRMLSRKKTKILP